MDGSKADKQKVLGTYEIISDEINGELIKTDEKKLFGTAEKNMDRQSRE